MPRNILARTFKGERQRCEICISLFTRKRFQNSRTICVVSMVMKSYTSCPCNAYCASDYMILIQIKKTH